MSKSVEEIGIGAALVGAAFVTGGTSLAAWGRISTLLASSGASYVLEGVGTLLSQKATGIHVTTRNPLAPWQVVYGRKKVGGTIFYQEEVASNNRILLLGIVVACHPCDAIESIWFDNRKIPMRLNSEFTDSSNPNGFLQSYTPTQGIWQIETISRSNDVVTVTFAQNPNSPWVQWNGETVWIRDTLDADGGDTLNGYFPVVQTGNASFTYACGGPQGAGRSNTGTIKSTWPDWSNSVTAGIYLGNQSPGATSGILIGNTAGYFTEDMAAQGRTWVALKLVWDNHYTGLPQISFVVRGKNDIYDPRSGQRGYSNNAALCIADYLAQPVWGFNAAYGSQIPGAPLAAAANVCDEQVALAGGGAEPRYCCDGAFDVSVTRGEVLANLLTSCAGRLIYSGGQFTIQPAAWYGPAGAIQIGDGSGAASMMMNQDGLVADWYANPARGRTGLLPDSAGSTADQLLFALGMLAAYQATGNGGALALAKQAMEPIAGVLFRALPAPNPVTAQNAWAPNWAYNVKQPFLSAQLRYGDTFAFVNGAAVIPDAYGEVRKVFQVATPGYVLSFSSPYAPLSSGTAYPIASVVYVAGQGTVVTLTDATVSDTLAVIYSSLSGPAVQVDDPFNPLPDWTPLGSGEIDCSCDALNWAMRLFALAALVIDGATPAAPDLGYGLSPYGESYGDPVTAGAVATSSNLQALAAIQQMAAIAYQVEGIPIFLRIGGGMRGSGGGFLGGGDGSGNQGSSYQNIPYAGGAIPYVMQLGGGTPPALLGWVGPFMAGYQSPWAVKQVGGTNVAAAVQFLYDAQAAWLAQAKTGDTLRVVVTGPNARTFTVPITAAGGTATANFSYAGVAAGTDAVQVFLDSKGLASNVAAVEWSPYPSFGAAGVVIQVQQADGSGRVNGPGAVLSEQAVDGLMFNAHPQSILPGDPHQSGNQASPMVCNEVDGSGNYVGDVAIAGTSGPFNAAITGTLVVPAAGSITFTAYVNASFVIGVERASYAGGQQSFGQLAATVRNGYTLLAGLNAAGDWPGGNYAQIQFTLSFPEPGLYPFEVDFASGLYSEREFCLLANGGVIPAVDVAAGGAPQATGTAPSGQLALTPYSAGDYLGQSQSFALTATGLSYGAGQPGPFAPCYSYPAPTGVPTWGTPNTWGWESPDPETISGRYQYRPLAELADLIQTLTGSESYYAQAMSVANTFLAWIDAQWSTVASGPPNLFPQSGAQTTAVDPHLAALILHAVIALDLAARPTGAGAMGGTLSSLLTKCYTLFGDLYLSTGPMAGTFCTDPTGAQDWHGHWHGEILRTLAMLVDWAAVNGNAAMKAQAIIWIDGMIEFAAGATVTVNPDLGYTPGDLRGSIVWRPALSKTSLFNGIKGSYISEANQWQQSDFPSYAQDTVHGYTNGASQYENDANWEADGARLWKDIQLPFTTSVSAAQRIAKIELMRIRRQGRGTLQGMMRLYQQSPLDVVYFSFAPFGWRNKLLEIASVRLVGEQSGGVVALGTDLDLRETDASDYQWSATEELSAQGYSYIPGLANATPD